MNQTSKTLEIDESGTGHHESESLRFVEFAVQFVREIHKVRLQTSPVAINDTNLKQEAGSRSCEGSSGNKHNMTIQGHERGRVRLGQNDCLRGEKEIYKEISDLSYFHSIHKVRLLTKCENHLIFLLQFRDMIIDHIKIAFRPDKSSTLISCLSSLSSSASSSSNVNLLLNIFVFWPPTPYNSLITPVIPYTYPILVPDTVINISQRTRTFQHQLRYFLSSSLF